MTTAAAETSITVHHGTSAEFAGYPTPQTDVYGFHGVFMTECYGDAEYFAEANTAGADDGEGRVFTAIVDMTGAVDLTEYEGDTDAIVAAYLAVDAPVYILPDMSGVSEREILVSDTRALVWR